MNPDPISSDRFDRLRLLFKVALEQSPEGRGAFLDAACPDDPLLRSEIEALLDADDQAEAGSFLEAPLFPRSAGEQPDLEPDEDLIDQVIGPYRLLRLIGHGGMGEVYLAQREAPFKQYVALKITRHGLHTPDALQRFEMERQILASLNHPNIARLLDGGTTDEGRSYIVMENVEGVPITVYCDSHRHTIAERLDLFKQVCQAVRYAHQNLVVHRDLKPSNILVTQSRSGQARVKLLDFGVAKLLNPTFLSVEVPVTRTMYRMMTPEYAAPEQVRGEAVTTATDVYALGVLLYELLAGHRPYRLTSRSPGEIERVICEQEPERPSTKVGHDEAEGDGTHQTITVAAVCEARGMTMEGLRRLLQGDLDNIVLKALRKEKQHRYGSVEELLADVGRYLAGHPVEARASTVGYRVRKFVARHRWGVGATLLLLFLFGAYGVTVTMQARRLALERDRSEMLLSRSEAVTEFLVGLFEGIDPVVVRGEEVTARELLEQGATRVSDLSEEPMVQAKLLDVIGRVYRNLGEYAQAQALLARALALRRTNLPSAHPDVARSLTTLAVLQIQIGDYAAADAMLLEALDQQRRLFEGPHEDIALSLTLQAGIHRHNKDFDAAEALYRQALAIYDALEGEHPDESGTLNELALLMRLRGDYATSEVLHRQALAIQRRLLGEGHSYVATSLSNLAVVLYNQKNYDEAEQMAREALSRRQELFDEQHPRVATSLNLLGLILQAKEDYAMAESFYRQALAARRARLGDEHPDVALTMKNLASLLHAKGDYDAAEALHREALAMRRRLLDADHPNIAVSLWNLAAVLRDKGAYAASERLYLEALAIYEERYEDTHVDVQTVYRGLAGLYEAWGKPEEAARYQDLLRRG